MLKEERFQIILDQLGQDQKVLLGELSSRLQVSEDTIRRDIRELSDRGLLRAVRGGAVPHAPGPHAFRDRMTYGHESKEFIAQKALGLFKNGQSVIFDGGTSTLLIAKLLPRDIKLTVITNSFPVASVLEELPNVDVYFAGGKLLKTSFVTTGAYAANYFGNFRADLCLLGICSIHPQLGVTGPDLGEAEVKRAMIASSQEVVALASLEKLGTVEAFHVCVTGDLSAIITDRPDELKDRQAYDHLGIKIM